MLQIHQICYDFLSHNIFTIQYDLLILGSLLSNGLDKNDLSSTIESEVQPEERASLKGWIINL